MPECLYVEVFDGYRYEGVLASGSVSLEASHNLLSILTLWALPPWSRHQKIPQLVQLFKPMFLVVPFLLHSQRKEAGWRCTLLLHLRRGISCCKNGIREARRRACLRHHDSKLVLHFFYQSLYNFVNNYFLERTSA